MDGAGTKVATGGDDHHMNDAPETNGFLEQRSLPGDDLALDPENETASDEYEEDDDVEEPEPDPSTIRRKALLATGCCYDDRMKLHVNVDFSHNAHHPEDPRRIEEIVKTFKKFGLLYTGPEEDLPKIVRDTPTKFMWRIGAREATKEEILTVHTPAHYDWVESLSEKTYAELRELTKVMDAGVDSLYVGSLTFPAALLAAGGAIDTCKHVVEGSVKNAFAVIRPPGHHAELDRAMGFCFFNNVPVAARVCQQLYPETCRKVLILDWDVHHGNGTQNMFYTDPNVLYISIHVYQNGLFYPGQPENSMTPDGGIENCGTGLGLGKNINIGWHDQGMGDGEYMAAFQKIVMPISQEFDPDLVIISAGFDAADGDELGGCYVTPACYAHMTHMLMSLADGKVAVCLEGGYNLQSISNSALAVARTLMGEPPPKMGMKPINKKAHRLLARVQAYQAPYWECMRPGVVDVPELQGLNGIRLHEIIRAAQRQRLSEKHNMVPLYIQRDTLFKSFENQVLITPTLSDARRLLVIIHDPPQLMAQPDVIDNHLEPHNSWVVDGVMQYIDWAISQNFDVMDVNVPQHVSADEDPDPYYPTMDEKHMEAQIMELVCYLWDNYIQLHDSIDEIFLMGVGNAYLGVKSLLMNRGLDCRSRIAGVVNFVNGALRPVKSDVDQDLSSWYKQNSRVYVERNHACWSNPDYARKVQKKRFGTVVRSEMAGLSRMMQAHAAEAQEWIMGRVSDDKHGDTTEDEKMA